MERDDLISADRVVSGSSLEECLCPICRCILWKPVACKTCLNSFCLNCVKQWLEQKTICPFNCQYEQRKSPPILITLLSKLKIRCSYNECDQILPYESLEKHENECLYQLLTCRGCEKMILRKDLVEHEKQCDLVDIECKKCKYIYKQKDAMTHDAIQCLECSMNQKLKGGQNLFEKTLNKYKRKQGLLEEQIRMLKADNENIQKRIRKLEKASRMNEFVTTRWNEELED
ncbi:unnamed protein product [Didymodactylos carnosus]|uniref:RING-type domain-containing protein n=1 Tax=Didymodactylos carnosus TaxID=1234261 RepID=A0A8S2FLC4_9BILA|nr:unnamed protein product [Didymodactylos carnosus]CAF4293879.1 unnamed protein product [Didymodactylos carnosus]